MKTIPAAIGNLVSLRELNLSGNQLSYLPHTLLHLKHLQLLHLRPNPLLSPTLSESQEDLPTPPGSQINLPAVLRVHQCPSRPMDASQVPSLSEFASRTLASVFSLAEIDKVWELPEYLRDRAIHAEERYRWRDTCAICGKWYVDEPTSTNELGCIEWYDSLCGNNLVPVKKGLCSWACISRWNEDCIATLSEEDEQVESS